MPNVHSDRFPDHPQNLFSSIALSTERFGWAFFFLSFPLGNTTVALTVLLVAAVLGWVSRSRPVWPFDSRVIDARDPFHVSVVLFICAMGISILFARDKLLASLVLIAFLLMYYLVICGGARVIQGQMANIVHRLLPWVIVMSSIGSAYALYTYFILRQRRAVGLFVTQNGLGMISAFLLILTIGYLLKTRRWPLSVIAMGLQLGALVVSFSRGSWLGFIAAVIVLCLLLLLQSEKRLPVIALLLITFTVGALVMSQSEPVKRRFVSSFSVAANQDRVRVWSAAVNMIKENPWVGVGGGNFPVVYSEYRTENDRSTSMAFAHNMFLQITAEFGVLGLVPFVTMIAIAFRRGWKLASRGDPLVKALFAGYIGMMVHDMVDNVTYGMSVGAMFWLITGIWVASIKLQSKPKKLG